jgi:hypothetical protein
MALSKRSLVTTSHLLSRSLSVFLRGFLTLLGIRK